MIFYMFLGFSICSSDFLYVPRIFYMFLRCSLPRPFCLSWFSLPRPFCSSWFSFPSSFCLSWISLPRPFCPCWFSPLALALHSLILCFAFNPLSLCWLLCDATIARCGAVSHLTLLQGARCLCNRTVNHLTCSPVNRWAGDLLPWRSIKKEI